MAQIAPGTANRLGPFQAGSTSADLIALVNAGTLGLRLLEPEEQTRDYYKARCEAIEKATHEFFFPYEGCRSLIFQKIRESSSLPEFTEYVCCWFVEDQLCGTVLSGVTSDAGTHAQMNEQESALHEHAAEVIEALGCKYPESPRSFVNDFQFEVYSAVPEIDGQAAGTLFTPFERLVTTIEENEPCSRIETAFCGPALVQFTGKPQAVELPTGSTHSSQSSRSAFASPDCLVVYDFKLERYVRTIESVHVYENLTYVFRALAADLGRRLNTRHAAQVRDQAQVQIDQWQTAISRAEAEKRARIARLMEIL
jgi:hypothetical protein